MKKLKYLFVLLLAILVLPVVVYAEGEETTDTSEAKEVNVYLFRGEGCPHCQEAEEWFQSIEEEHGYKFKVVDYETWYDEDNAALMQKVAEAKGEQANGVPYIIVGNKSWNGFTSEYGEEILAEIDAEYAKADADRYDIMKLLPNGVKKEEKKSNDVLVLILILVVVGGVCFGVYKARNNTN